MMSLESGCSCANDPNFAIICAFLQKFGCDLNIDVPNFKQLQEWLTKTDEVTPQLRDLHIKLMRKNRKTVHEKSWESALSKFCFSYSAQDAWEIERFGYKNASLKVKLRILKELLESQFERNTKFRAKILTQSAESLRSEPIGRDRLGHAYWITQDNDCNLRIYQEHLDEDIWQVVATNRDEFVNLIERLRGNEVVLPSNDIGIIDEDTSSSNSYADTETKINAIESTTVTIDREQKVPKLSIKISNDKNINEDDTRNYLKEEEEELINTDNDRSKNKYTNNDNDENEVGDDIYKEKLEDVENSICENSRKIEPLLISQKQITSCSTKSAKKQQTVEHQNVNVKPESENEFKKEFEEDYEADKRKNTECSRTVEPLLLSKKQMTITENEINNSIKTGKKRLKLEDREAICQNDDESSLNQDAKATIPESKRYKMSKIFDDEDKTGEEDRKDSAEDTNSEEDIEEEDIDSVAAEEDENEEKQIEEFDDDDIRDVVVGDVITDPVLHVQGEGSGNDCESEFFNDVGYSFDEDCQLYVSEAVEENIFYICGEGSGSDCLIGNSRCEEKATTGSASKESLTTAPTNETVHLNKDNSDDTKAMDNNQVNDDEDNKEEIEASKAENEIKVTNNGEGNTESSDSKNSASRDKLTKNDKHQAPPTNDKPSSTSEKGEKSTTALQKGSERDVPETTDSKSLDEKVATNTEIPPSFNRKRRLANFGTQQSQKNIQSESEVDVISENTEDYNNEQDDMDEPDVGGKRLKMRPKQSNVELRKKVEAQKAAAHEEINSSSGGEENTQRRRKLASPKKHVDRKTTKHESAKNSDHNPSSSTNTNGAHENIAPSTGKTMLSKEKPSTSDTSVTARKQKKTLEDLIDKKFKIPQEENDESNNSCPKEGAKSQTPSTKKSPITKPLKKNLLKQIWHEENEKQNLPDNLPECDDKADETPSVVDKGKCNKNKINERQRKRHSSEEADQRVVTEEPEAKKEVLHKEFIGQSETEIIKSRISVPKDSESGDNKDEVKEEIDEPTFIVGRRSTRRGNGTSSMSNKTRPLTKKVETNSESSKANVIESTSKKGTESVKVSCENSKTISTHLSKPDKTENDKTEAEEKALVVQVACSSNTASLLKKATKGTRKQREVDTTNIIDTADAETPVRQSRRIAQLKIREEAERRKLEEIALRTMKQELKKKKKAEKQADPTVLPPSEPSSESEESDVDTKKKTQKKKCPGKNGSWSSGSEEQEDPDEEEDEEHHHYETDPGSPLFRSDHEFSPESDIEDETQVVPTKRARTARKENDVDNEPDEEEACQKCHKSDHPEWILLCDKCDKGYHCSCLSPVLFYIPEGDWYCPPCQQEQLIKALEGQLNEFDEMVERKKREEEAVRLLEEKEKARLKEEEELSSQNKRNIRRNQRAQNGSSSEVNSEHSGESDALSNSNSGGSEVENKKSSKKKSIDKRRRNDRRQYSARSTRRNIRKSISESDSNSHRSSNSESASKSESSSSYSDSDDEPIYKLRKRRQLNVSYRLNEYDDLINSALKKEMDEVAGAGNLGRGKDISTIIEADKEEKARQKQLENVDIPEEKEENVDESKEKDDTKNIESESDDELIKNIIHSKSSKKKARKLTTLDISSEDDDGSDEDFKGSSVDEEDDSFGSGSINSDSSLEVYKRKSRSKKTQRRAARRAFRERRKDRKFIVDNSDEDEVQKPKSKKKRKVESDYTESELDDDDLSELSNNIDSADLCDDTTTDESDGAWRPNKRKKSKKASQSTSTKTSKPKARYSNKSKKEVYSDDDITDTDDGEIGDDSNGAVGGGKQPRSQPLKTNANTNKSKAKSLASKKLSDEEKSFSDSGDSTRRTRGRRYAYIEDFDDDSSDGGIKPGVKRPDTPPEEREKFIKRQEEIKRMLAEKNAEGAKLVATPRLTPIKSDCEKDKKSPSKPGGDALSTVPMSVIKQAKVLDIDYLQRRGEHLDDSPNDVGDVDDEFDDADLPDDLPEDMDEDAIARMVEDEEDFASVATRDLPPPDEIIRTPPVLAKTKPKIVENIPAADASTELPTTPLQPPIAVTPSGLQEPVRKRFPMPTMHPPLLRHQHHETVHGVQNIVQRHIAPQLTHLLQNALSSPVHPPYSSAYPMPPTSSNNQSLISRMTSNTPVQPTASQVNAPCRTASPLIVKSTQQINMQSQNKASAPTTDSEVKPRGRRKKITPLRDTLQKQQTAAAVAAAASASTSAGISNSSIGIIKTQYPFKASESVIRETTPTKVPQTQGNVIGTMQPRSLNTMQHGPIFAGPEGFYGAPSSRIPHSSPQRHRGPPPITQSHLTTHSAVRHSYGPPPPLKGAISTPSAPTNVRQVHLPPFMGSVQPTRHSSSHLNVYGPPIYGNPSFVHRGNHRPPLHSTDYPPDSRPYPPYNFYPPPPPLTTPVRSQMALQQPPTSVITPNVPPSTVQSSKDKPATSRVITDDTIPKSMVIKQEITSESTVLKTTVQASSKTSPESRKQLTSLEEYAARNSRGKSPISQPAILPTSQDSPSNKQDSPDDHQLTTPHETTTSDRQGSEFSGLVSYFSSQHDDYNT
ncbi:uncharacterized protein [Musca autumnalis]|uniref:uncharacterized protein n=1 Tax=Musca autumnalis TaxID=221902 RepID=UPI003CF5341E